MQNHNSIYVNVEGVLDYYVYGLSYSTFNLIKESKSYFSVSVDAGAQPISHTVERRLTILETGDYNFSFSLAEARSGDYLNYEVLLAETEIIYQPKTSIIAEAPYGIAIIFVALIGVTIVQLRKRREK